MLTLVAGAFKSKHGSYFGGIIARVIVNITDDVSADIAIAVTGRVGITGV
jgi:hypothetical protein